MAEIDVGGGILVRTSDDVDVRLVHDGPARRGVRRATASAVPAAGSLRDALAAADFSVQSEIQFVPRRSGTRAFRSAGEEPTTIVVPAGPSESALVLVESEGGAYGWVFPDEARAGPSGRRLRGARTLTFALSRAAGAPGTRRLRVPTRLRGIVVDWIADRVVEPVRAYVVKFTARRSVDEAVAFVEGDMKEGLVSLGDDDPGRWHPGGTALPGLDRDRPARVLLMIHGTFSSTSGSFAGLAATPSGRAFLEAVRQDYDAVLGFDHKTLAIGPTSNAEDLAAALEQYGLPRGTTIDAVAHSRGGLVYRSFEALWARNHPEAAFGKAVFIGCTNAGTHLAEPANWAAMLDLYTNVAMAAARGLLALTGGAAYSPFATGCIKTIGRFVQALSEVAIGEDRVPGLAAMQPASDLVKALNEARDAPDRLALYHAVTSNFVAELGSGRGIGRDLAEFVVDRVTNRLFGSANDLVVDTASMVDFGSRRSRLGPEAVMALTEVDHVYHVTYFAEPAVAAQIGDWLRGDGSEVRKPAKTRKPPASRRGRAAASPRPPIAFDLQSRTRSPGGDRGYGGGPPAFRFAPDDIAHGVDFAPDDIAQGVDTVESPRRRRMAKNPAPPPRKTARAPETSIRKMVRKPAAPAPKKAAAARPPVQKDATVACHFAAEMDPHPPLKTPAPLFVTVSRDAIAVAAHEAARTTAKPVPVDAGAELSIEVIALRNARVLGEAVRTLAVPEREDTVRFRIEGMAPGVADLLIEARQGTRTLVSFSLRPVFIAPDDAKLTASRTAAARPPTAEEPAVLRIYEIEDGGRITLRFDLACFDPNINVSETLTLPSGFSRDAYVADIYRTLETTWVDAGKVYDQFLLRLQANGMTMAHDLLPERVRKALWRHRGEIRAIQVISGEPLIPWELLYVTDPEAGPEEEGFLGEWGLVRWLYDTDWPGRRLRLRRDRVRYVVPDYADPGCILEGANAERGMLDEIFDEPRAVPADSKAVAEFLRTEAKDCDVIHFACHGEAVQRAVLKADLLMSGAVAKGAYVADPLTSDLVKVRATFATPGPSGLVFINACQTGRGGVGLSHGVGGFVEAFLRPFSKRGAAALVGALWSVDDDLALAFAEDFYRALLAGGSLVEAARAGRNAAKARGELTWLAYTVYGNPFARIETSPGP